MPDMFRRSIALIVACLLLAGYVMPVAAAPPANMHFQRTWQRTDQPVASLVANRTWMWGPAGFTGAMDEMYAEGPGGVRTVQYFDKSRMEITDPDADPNTIWYVTNGLLVMELVTGEMQLGHASFLSFSPAEVNVAGDHDDPTGPTYETFGALLDEPALADNATITQRVDRNAIITDDPALAVHGVFAAQHVVMPGIDHQVASVFWTFMNSNATVYENGNYTNDLLFENPFYATGYPVAEAYWAEVKVAETYQDVLIQCFERRCLTYNPGNGPGWQVEAGNVGQHYHHWRYVQVPGEEEVPELPENPGVETATEYQYLNTFGNEANPFNDISIPTGLEVGPNGNLYVIDNGRDRVQIYSQMGVIVGGWGSSGTDNSHFDTPEDIAFDSDGNAYVTDLSNHRVQKFTSMGVYLDQWGSFGNGAGQFQMADGIAINSENVVYVSDRFGHRIQMFDVDGNFIAQFGSFGNGNGQFFAPTAIAIDSNDNVYVADSGNNRVQKFAANGNYVTQWGTDGSAWEQFNGLQSLAVVTILGTEYIYTTENAEHRIQSFTLDGDWNGGTGTHGSGFGQLDVPLDIAGGDNNLVFVGEFGNNRVQVYGLDLQPKYMIEGDSRGRFDTPVGMAIDSNGDVLVADYGLVSLQRFSAGGAFLDDLNVADAELVMPIGVAIDDDGMVYVTDASQRLVVKMDGDGEVAGTWGGPGAGNGQFTTPTGIAVEGGFVYVTDTGLHRVQKFTIDGDYVGQWGSHGNGDGQFLSPNGIAAYGDRVYVTDSSNQRVQIFDTNGTYLGQFGSFGAGNGQFVSPMMIATDDDGYLYVTDFDNHRVQKFSPDGDYVTQFGAEGSANSELNGPLGIAVAQNGTVYVVEFGNQRIHMFEPVQ